MRLRLLLLGCAGLCASLATFASDAPPRPLLGAGAVAPDFSSFDLDGREVRLAEYRGRVLILDFWATWCGPCIASMPHTQEVAARYAGQGVAVLAVCTGDKRRRFEDWVKLKGPSYPALRFTFDPHEQGTATEPERASFALYGVPAIPTQFIIDREGRIAGTTTGYVSGDRALERALAAAGVQVDPAAADAVRPGVTRAIANSAEQPSAAPAGETPAAPRPAPAPRRPAPPFTETVAKVKAGDQLPDVDFLAPDGVARRLADYRGRPLVLFLGSAEMIPDDYLNGIVERYGAANVHVLAVVTRDAEASYRTWLAQHGSRGNRFATAFDPAPAAEPRRGVINRLFNFGAPTPFSIVIDADGKFAGMFPWKLPQGQAGLAELLRRCGVPVPPGDLPAAAAVK